MREYAVFKLREEGVEQAIEVRCVGYYVSTCQRSAFQARFRLIEWLEWMELEIDNVRSVLRRCLTHADFASGIILASSVSWYWITRATTEGVRWLDELLAPGRSNPETDAWAYFIRGFLAVLQSDPGAARPALERAVAAAREAGLPIAPARSPSLAAQARNMAADPAPSTPLSLQAQDPAPGLANLLAPVRR